MIGAIIAELGKSMKVSEDFSRFSMLLISLTNQEKRLLFGLRPDIPGENLCMHSFFHNFIRVSDVDRPHGFECVILDDCTSRCNA